MAADLLYFDHDEAWTLGETLARRCRKDGLSVTILVTIGEQRVFHVGLPGTSADRDSWADRKVRIVRRFAVSSKDVYEQNVRNKPDFFTTFALPRDQYAPYAGAVPITVRGLLVGAIAVAGLTSDADHELAAAALDELAARQTAGRRDSEPST